MLKRQLLSLAILATIALTYAAHSTSLNTVGEDGRVNFQSRFMVDEAGAKLTTKLPLGNLAGSDTPIFLDAIKERCEDTLMLLDIKSNLMAYGISEEKQHYAANKPLLDKFEEEPIHKLPEGLSKGPRMKSCNNFELKVDFLKFPLCFLEVNGSIRLETKALEMDAFFMPRSRFVIKSRVKACPITEIVLYLANNQLPMRVAGLVTFSENPIVELETMNVACIRVKHTY